MSIRLVCDRCGKTFEAQAGWPGGQARCAKCRGEAVEVKPLPDNPDPPSGEGGPQSVFDRDLFLLLQGLVVGDEGGSPVLYVKRPAKLGASCVALGLGIAAFLVIFGAALAAYFTFQQPGGAVAPVLLVGGIGLGLVACVVVIVRCEPKRHIGFYADAAREDLVLMLEQEKKWMVTDAAYTCRDSDGQRLGRLCTSHLGALFRRRWRVYDAEGRLAAVAAEDSVFVALLRVLDVSLPGLGPTSFVILGPDGRTRLGEFDRKRAVSGHHALNLSGDPGRRLDRRLAVALCVLLDTGERRWH